MLVSGGAMCFIEPLEKCNLCEGQKIKFSGQIQFTFSGLPFLINIFVALKPTHLKTNVWLF